MIQAWLGLTVCVCVQGVKRKLEVVEGGTGRAEETVKEAEAHLNAKEYDYQGLLTQLEQFKGRCWWFDGGP
jgi:copper chaperone CopZ